MKLQNKVAIVTGASRGIGAQIARRLAGEGAKLVVNYRDDQTAAATVVADIHKLGGEVVSVQADVGQTVQAQRLFDAAIERFGKVDFIINNAGIMLLAPIAGMSDADYERMFDINVKGTFNMLREAATRLEEGGRIVNLSSAVTRSAVPTYGPYSATKAAVEQMTRVFAKEIAPRRITVNSVAPGPTDTDLFMIGKSEDALKKIASVTPLGRIGTPDDIARVVLFLLSDEAAWVTAQNIGANGGFA